RIRGAANVLKARPREASKCSKASINPSVPALTRSSRSTSFARALASCCATWYTRPRCFRSTASRVAGSVFVGRRSSVLGIDLQYSAARAWVGPNAHRRRRRTTYQRCVSKQPTFQAAGTALLDCRRPFSDVAIRDQPVASQREAALHTNTCVEPRISLHLLFTGRHTGHIVPFRQTLPTILHR